MVKTTQPFMIDYREQGETVRLISSYNIASPLLALLLKYSMNTFNFCPLNQTVSHSIFIENLVLSYPSYHFSICNCFCLTAL